MSKKKNTKTKIKRIAFLFQGTFTSIVVDEVTCRDLVSLWKAGKMPEIIEGEFFDNNPDNRAKKYVATKDLVSLEVYDYNLK